MTGSTGTLRDVYSDAAAIDGEWVHLALVYNGADLRLYRDAVLQADIDTTAGTIDTANYVAYDIARHPTGSGYCEAAIDTLAIYDRGITPDDIAQLFSEPWAYYPRSRRYWYTSVIGGAGRIYWPMLRGTKINPFVMR